MPIRGNGDNSFTISVSNVVSSIYSLLPQQVSEVHYYCKPIMYSGIPWYGVFGVDSVGNWKVYVYVGNTPRKIVASGFGTTLAGSFTQLVYDSSDIYTVWCESPTPGDIVLKQCDSFGTITDYWVLATNPPNTLTPGDQVLFDFNVGKVGSVGAIVSVYDASGGPSTGVAYYLSPVGTPIVAKFPEYVSQLSSIVLPNPIQKPACYNLKPKCKGNMQAGKVVMYAGLTKSPKKQGV